MKYRSEFKHCFTNNGCLHCATLRAILRAHKSRDMQFFLQNVQNEIFRAASWINSKISNRGKNSTLKIFLFCHYCWSLLWCIISESLSSRVLTFQKNRFNENHLKMMKNAFYFILKALLVLKIFKCLCWLFGH